LGESDAGLEAAERRRTHVDAAVAKGRIVPRAEGREDVSELAVEADSEGITPTTVYEVPFKVRDFPMMPGEEPNRRVQKLPLRMTTGAAPT